ncbi:hypothetical protein K1719_006130 [Acacia pycnantha]|nr:hypothetical protein K1719_006130 [Acacia pycnantha]
MAMCIILQNLCCVLPDSSVSRKPSVPKFLNLSYKLGPVFIPVNREPRRNLNLRMAQAAQDLAANQKKVVIANKHGEKLVGILHESGTTDIVILCHGFGSSKETDLIANLAAALENAGISSFRFDFAGNGESEGSFEYGNYWREVEDLHSVAQHFCGEKRARTIVGHSKGGGVVLLYASKYHDIKTVVNISGRHDLKTGVEERLGKDCMERIKKDGFIDMYKSGDFLFRVTKESLMDRLNTNMHEACLQIDNRCRVLTVHGSADEFVGVESAYEFAKIIPNHKLHVIEGANHSFSQHQDELASVVMNFIKETFHQD